MSRARVYRWETRDGQGSEGEGEVSASSPRIARRRALEEAREWWREGDWGIHRCQVEFSLRVWPASRKPDSADWSDHSITIEPDHDALIREAVREHLGAYADASHFVNCAHRWTSEGMGGCDQNPGVWSLGGTTIATSERCKRCGIERHETAYGSQRNPGQSDEVRYSLPPEEDTDD